MRVMIVKSFDESKHPRQPAETDDPKYHGGEFIPASRVPQSVTNSKGEHVWPFTSEDGYAHHFALRQGVGFRPYAEFVYGGEPDHLYPDRIHMEDTLMGTPQYGEALRTFEEAHPSIDISLQKKGHARASAQNNMRDRAEREGKPCFIRFGKLPKSGKSYNSKENHYEKGVSVYPAYQLPNNHFLIDLAQTDSVSAMFIVGTSQMYKVRGEVVGTGSDGEPLLENCRQTKIDGTYQVIH